MRSQPPPPASARNRRMRRTLSRSPTHRSKVPRRSEAAGGQARQLDPTGGDPYRQFKNPHPMIPSAKVRQLMQQKGIALDGRELFPEPLGNQQPRPAPKRQEHGSHVGGEKMDHRPARRR